MAPARHPCAAFEPISPDLDLASLVEATPNFEFVVRIHCDAIDQQGIENFEKLVLLHVILGGKPLVVEGYQHRLEKWIFSLQWLRDNHAAKSMRSSHSGFQAPLTKVLQSRTLEILPLNLTCPFRLDTI
jgi:hypothetical protein